MEHSSAQESSWHPALGVLVPEAEIPPTDVVDDKTPWAQVFRRSRGYEQVFSLRADSLGISHIRSVLDAWGVGERTNAGDIFTSSISVRLWLDGGFFVSHGYGFRSLNGGWIFGTHAMAVLCDELAITRPRFLPTVAPQDLILRLREDLDQDRYDYNAFGAAWTTRELLAELSKAEGTADSDALSLISQKLGGISSLSQLEQYSVQRNVNISGGGSK